MDQDINKMNRADLEVQSRRMESELAVLRSRSFANPEGFKKSVDDRTKKYQTIQKRIREIDEGSTPVDPEGTSQTLADAEGHYASDAKVAAVGGTGVRNSNTDPDGVVNRQRKQLEQSGVDPDQVPQNQLANTDQSGDEGSGGGANQSGDQSGGDKSDQSREQAKNDPAQQPKKK